VSYAILNSRYIRIITLVVLTMVLLKSVLPYLLKSYSRNGVIAAGTLAVKTDYSGLVRDVGVKSNSWVNAGDAIGYVATKEAREAIVAPVSGIISKVVVSEGSEVNSGDVIANITDCTHQVIEGDFDLDALRYVLGGNSLYFRMFGDNKWYAGHYLGLSKNHPLDSKYLNLSGKMPETDALSRENLYIGISGSDIGSDLNNSCNAGKRVELAVDRDINKFFK
jgi:multidrug resistance efflux pump